MLLIYMLTGFTISLLAVPLITSFAKKAHIVDIPSERKIHIDNVPLLGGLGIFISYFVVVMLIDSFSVKTYALLGANIIIIITGVLDDTFNLNAPRKLFGQIAATTIILLFTDFRFSISVIQIDLLSHPIFNVFFTYLWIVGVTNALNLIDGMDGLAGGIAFMAFGAIGYAAYAKGFELNAYICMGLMGATLGFLRYNIPPAKVFMGDTGSLFLGFNIAVMSIAASHKSGTFLSVLIPVMFISLPLFDTLLAIVRRTLKGQNPMSADKEHLHHRLLSLEFSSVQTLMIFYSLSIILIAISIFSFKAQFIWGSIIILMLLYMFFLILKLFHLFDAGVKIRSINEKMREYAVKISKHNLNYNYKTRILDIIIVFTTVLFMIKFIRHNSITDYQELSAGAVFLTALFIIMTYRKISDIKNQFVSFGFYWIFFYIATMTVKGGLSIIDTILLSILAMCIILKILIKRQIDLFISNPMELIMLFCLMIIYLSTNTPASDFFIVSGISFILYYANKFFLVNKCSFNSSYSAVMITLVIIFTFVSSLSTLNISINGITVAMTPSQLKTELKKLNKTKEYEQGRELLITYNQKKPFSFMKKECREESAKIYFNLIIDSLFAGKLEVSDTYLREFLAMYPDLVNEFYGIIEPVLSRLPMIEIKGRHNVQINGIETTKIAAKYSDTLKSFAENYAIKGYTDKSSSYLEIATLINDLVIKNN